MLEWDGDLRVGGTGLFVDSRAPRGACVVSHAHSDHIALHDKVMGTPATLALARHRVGPFSSIFPLFYHISHPFDSKTTLELRPAGHVLGSAMLHVTRPEGTLLYTGDFSLQRSLAAEAADPCPADHLVIETTYGLPQFRFPPRELVVEQLLGLVESALRAGRQPIVLGYSLGKAQEVTKILTQHQFPVTLHGAPYNLARIYDEHLPGGLGRYRRYAYEDFHGAGAVDLRCRGVLVAPPYVARTGFVARFKNPLTIVMTGWAMLKGASYRYGVDHALPFSDHADFPQLVSLVERVGARRVYTHHGYTREFAEYLRGRGIDARPVVPDGQMVLFE